MITLIRLPVNKAWSPIRNSSLLARDIDAIGCSVRNPDTKRPHVVRKRTTLRAIENNRTENGPKDVITLQEVQDIARTRGIFITVSNLGPAYRIICRDGNPKGSILGVTSGFTVAPLGLMHCDTLQIFTQGQKGELGYRIRGGMLGLGLLIGGATFAFGYEQGCRKAEILAINDDDVMHARLVRYYSRFGFEPVLEVSGGKLSDLQHMLVWGGTGTRMDADIEIMLTKWTQAIRNTVFDG